MNRLAILLVACCIIITDAVGAPAAAAPASAPAKGGELYQQVTRAYMMCDWPELDRSLKAAEAAKADLTAEQQADVKYVREALAECRPAWWSACKTAKAKFAIRPILWGKPVAGVYDPAGKGGVQMQTGPQGTTVTMSWAQGEMDSAEAGGYGYLKGDVAGLSVWGGVAMAQIWPSVPPQTLAKMTDAEKMRFQMYLDVRSNLAILYYCTPTSRRYAMHIYFAAYHHEKAGKSTGLAGRRAVCSGIMQEIIKDPARYPSLKLPGKLDADQAEQNLGKYYKGLCKRNDVWTIAEDRSFRAAIKAFAAVPDNDKPLWQSQKVALSDGLIYHLDPAEDDKSFRAKRDAWFKEKFEKAGK